MPQDSLQIALEHHRAGRLMHAEAGYKMLLETNPRNADALHWLGVLLCQAGQVKEAIALLEKAASIRPADVAFQHNLGQAYLNAGQKDQAIQAFERATANATETEPLIALAQARLSRRMPGDADAAVAALRRAQSLGVETADLHHHLGVALLAAGRASDAISAFQAALVKKPNDAATYYHMALAHRTAGQIKETRKCLIEALEVQPELAQAWCGLAMLDVDAGKLSEAAGLFRRAISANRNYAAAYRGLGQVLQLAGKHDEARAVLEQAQGAARGGSAATKQPSPPSSVAELERQLTPTPLQAQAHFAMAALMNVFPPNTSPTEGISGLFDRYAATFDNHLVGALEYRVPEMVTDAIRAVWDGKPMDVLDLGCGTGLCGPLLRPMAATLTGVDLSSAMIEKAKERNIYDRLEVADLVEVLRKAPRGYDLLVAADVLIYIGDLSPTFEAAAMALRPGGLLAFSVESSAGERYELVQRSRRFAHSKPYLQRLSTIYGFREVQFENVVLRKEADQPVAGYLVVLRMP